MQIDFHHGVTYVTARLAGMSPAHAAVVAYSAQYVDDATNGGVIRFDEGSSYSRISSAHRMLDYRNFEELAASRVWVPFHFLPSNGGMPIGASPVGGRIAALTCRPDSPVARLMVRRCIQAADRPWALHRLGIAMHVYADTWAHQGFAGIPHVVNEATDIRLGDEASSTSMQDRMTAWFVGSALPLGHGTVLSFPDKPWLQWSYVNGLGQRVSRDNPSDFMEAAQRMCQVMRRFVLRDADAEVRGIGREDRATIRALLMQPGPKEERHARWLAAIAEGAFSFGPEALGYIGKGQGSWKHSALNTAEAVDRGDETFRWKPAFLGSHWRRFHDALQEHRFDVLHVVLPQFGISVG